MSLSNIQRWIKLMLTIGAPGENPAPMFPRGGRILFAGHSFFVPVARTFNRIAQFGPTHYPDHVSLEPVFSGGESGSPLNLWKDPQDRNAILAALESDPPPEVLALTLHEDTIQEHYQLWLDAAKSRVPDIALLIVFPFAPMGAVTPLDEYGELARDAVGRLGEVADALREDNPDNAIYAMEQASTSVSMKSMFEDGLLDDDVPNGLLCGSGCLFRDAEPGHPGEMMYDMAALVWLHILYGMDPTTYTPPYKDWYSEDAVRNITTVAIHSNEIFDLN